MGAPWQWWPGDSLVAAWKASARRLGALGSLAAAGIAPGGGGGYRGG
jgi:hypothetical protein